MAAEPFDVVVIGSGAAGGTAAYVLTQAGARVCVLEAGRSYDPATETPMFNTNRGAPRRAQARRTSRSASTTRRWTAAGTSPASPMRPRRARRSAGGGRGCSERMNHWRSICSASPSTTSRASPPTATGRTGRSATPSSRPGTTRPGASLASPAGRGILPALPGHLRHRLLHDACGLGGPRLCGAPSPRRAFPTRRRRCM